ncbi:MAG: SMP-30/gluconolactonase/LRE family protein [Phycisphaeraceae bacterium]|nr:SMP-30/gluconolactonase/LRE family protein [Phycisphaeraceae bacterium]
MTPPPLEVEIVLDPQCKLGENPLWSPDEKCLYWTDILGRKLHRFDPATGGHEVILDGHTVGGFTLNIDGSLLLFMDQGRVAVFKDGRIVRNVIERIDDEVHSRFNDVIADPEGRVFCGTMPVPESAPGGPRLGRLYRLDPDGSYRIVLEEIGCSNGMGFSPDLDLFYYTDSTPRTIYLFDFHRQSGDLSNRAVWYQTPDSPDVPDGMTVDRAGHVWSARWGGHEARYIDPQGRLLSAIKLPAAQVTSMIFGGDQLDELYITSAATGKTPREGENAHAGALFRCKPPCGGLPEFRSGFRA